MSLGPFPNTQFPKRRKSDGDAPEREREAADCCQWTGSMRRRLAHSF